MRSRVLAFTALLVLVAATTTALAEKPGKKEPWERMPWEGRPPYGLPMMTEGERKTYWAEIQSLPTVEETEAYWRAHIEKMRQRALERGVALPPPPRRLIPDDEQVARPRPPYLDEIMTAEERKAYYETMEALEVVPAERDAFVADHIERMRARGLARGISLPSTADFTDVLEGPTNANTVEPEDDDAELDEESEAFDDGDE